MIQIITIDQVAKLAGVSRATVSRVINNNGYVSNITREKVEKVIKDNKYVPSALATNLSKKHKNNVIGVIVPEIHNMFFSEVLQGIAEVCETSDLSFICCDTSNNIHKENRALKSLIGQRVRGLIFAPAVERNKASDMELLETYIKELGVPIVILDRYLTRGNWHGVHYEDEQSGYLATKELIKAGNTNLAMLTGNLSLRIATDRYQGFLRACKEYNIADTMLLKGDLSIQTAYTVSKEMLASKNLPQGIVTSNNLSSLGFLRAASEAGITIGKDIAMVGIDHIEVLDMINYNLSAVTRDTVKMGRTAMELLNHVIENNLYNKPLTPDTAIHKVIPCITRLRGSETRKI